MIYFIQPTLRQYRVIFFNRLSKKICKFTVFFGGLGSGNIQYSKPLFTLMRARKIPLFFGFTWQSSVRVFSLKKKDLVVISTPPQYLSNLFIILMSFLLRYRVIIWAHYWSATSSTTGFVFRQMLSNFVSGLIFYTDDEVESYSKSRFFNHKINLIGLNNGLDAKKNRLLSKPYCAALRPLEIVFIGRLTKKSEINLLIESLLYLKNINIVLNVVGDVGDDVFNYRKMAKDIGVDESINWVGGAYVEADISAIFNRSRIFVYPGAVGLSLVHAMTYGVPAIIHNVPSLHMPERSAFTEGETGELFRKGSPISLAYTIRKLIGDVNKLNNYSRRSLDITFNSFNFEDMVDRMSSFLLEFR